MLKGMNETLICEHERIDNVRQGEEGIEVMSWLSSEVIGVRTVKLYRLNPCITRSAASVLILVACSSCRESCNVTFPCVSAFKAALMVVVSSFGRSCFEVTIFGLLSDGTFQTDEACGEG